MVGAARALVAGVALATLVGCGGSTSAGVSTSTSSSSSTSTSTTTASTLLAPTTGATAPPVTAHPATTTHATTATTRALPVTTVNLTVSDDGRTVTVAPGSTIVVVFDQTRWTLPPPAGTALHQQGVVTTPAKCVPGGVCGTTSGTYLAVAAGTAMITASRNYCGEAITCNGQKVSFAVDVVVNG